MGIKFKRQTIELLQGLSQLNPGIVFDGTSVLKSISTDRRTIATATIPETIPSTAGVGSIDKFVNQTYLFDEAEVTFDSGQSRFAYQESAQGSTPKQSYYAYTPVVEIVTPDQIPPDIQDNDVEFTITSSDLLKVLQAIERDKNELYFEKSNDISNAQNEATPEIPTITQENLGDLDALQRISQQYAEALSAIESPNTQIEESSYRIEIYGQAPNSLSIYIERDGERMTELLSLSPQITTPDFFDDFSFYLNPDDITVISGISYNVILSSSDDVVQFIGEYPYNEVTDNTEQYNADQAAYQSELSDYEAQQIEFENNQEIYDNAEQELNQGRQDQQNGDQLTEIRDSASLVVAISDYSFTVSALSSTEVDFSQFFQPGDTVSIINSISNDRTGAVVNTITDNGAGLSSISFVDVVLSTEQGGSSIPALIKSGSGTIDPPAPPPAPTEQEIIDKANEDPAYTAGNSAPIAPTAPTAPDTDAYLPEQTFSSIIKYWIPVIYLPR